MDNLTHTLFALTVARTPVGRAGAGTTAALVIGSNAPDAEFLAAFTNGRLGYLSAHRGPSHGVIGWAVFSLLTSLVVLALTHRRDGRTGATFPALVGVGALAVGLHIAMDFATSYGTRVLSPFSDVWYGVDLMPIVDVYLWAILGAGLISARVCRASSARIAVATLALVGAFYGVRASAHEAAVRRTVLIGAGNGKVTGASLPTPGFLFHYGWPDHPAALPAALPTFWSPFEWRVFRRVHGGYEVGDISVLGPPALRNPTWHQAARPEDARWVRLAAEAPTAATFLAFARFPAVHVSRRPGGEIVVRWNDVRFAEPGRRTSEDGSNPASRFGAHVRLDPAGRILAHGLGPG